MLNGLPWKQIKIIASFFEIATKHCTETLVDYGGYYEEFLPTVVDTVVT